MRGGRGVCVDASPDASEISSPQTPPPPSFALRATDGPPPPLPRGRMKQAISFSRCDPHPSHRHATRISSLSAPTFARECRRWTPVSSRSALRATMYERRKQGSGTPTDAYPTSAPLRVRRAQSAARSPLGVPPRLCARWDVHPQGSTWARLRDTRFHAGVTRCRLCQSSDAPRAPVIVPARLMPKAAREWQ